MKKLTFLILCLLPFLLSAQELIGAWESTSKDKDGNLLKSVVIFADGYQVLSTFDANTGKFVHTNGGTWKLDGNRMHEKVEFHTDHPERVGMETSFDILLAKNELSIVGSEKKFTRIDDGTPGALNGAWLMSGRIRDGNTQTRNTNVPRKTMKILSGTRFQWIAYNTQTKEFMGTGGGTYETNDGKYTEHIEFFSRDDKKAGLSLGFDYELIDGKWHHSGLSSKGDPIHEIWSRRAPPHSKEEAARRIVELDRYWKDLAITARDGDYKGMWALYHDDAVLVKPDTTIAISDAFKYRWKKEILEVKEGKRKNTLDFRFSRRVGNQVSAFEKGIYHYTSVDTATGKTIGDAYVHFETLLVKKEDKWLTMMEYQLGEASAEEWKALK